MHRSLIVLFFCFSIILFYNCERDSNLTSTTESEPDTSDHWVVKKPNIYIYPKNKLNFFVQIVFPPGGKVIESIPAYGSGWDITVDETGLINNQYQYLFYEAETANLYQNSKGWFVTGDTLKHFFETNLFACGFNQKEITDFTDYWIPLLDPKLDYLIYPQFKEEIDPIITLNFSVEPDCILRLFYVIEKYQGYPAELEEPVIHKFERIGFIVTEWGVILRGNGL